MEEIRNFVEYVKDFITDKLPDYEGEYVYGCDLGYTITEEINVSGTATLSKQRAMKYIKEWWFDAAEVYRYQKENYGEALQNPFENPEAWMVCMIIEGVDSVLGQCDIVEEFWNDETELTEEIINKILEYVDSVEEIEF